MRKLWIISKREYLTRVRTKTFVLSTVGFPLLSIGILAFTVIVARRQSSQTVRIAILDNSGDLAAPIARGLNEKLPDGRLAFQVVETLDKPQDAEKVREQLRVRVRQGELDSYLVIPRGVLEGKEGAEFHTQNPGDVVRIGSVRRAVSDAVIARRLSDRGFRTENLIEIVRSVDITLLKITKQGEAEEKGQTFFVGLGMITMLYITLIIYGVSTMRSVLEEKTTHIIEILVSSVRPIELLSAKILGVAAVALTQYLIWTITSGLLAGYGTAMAKAFSPGAASVSIHLPTSTLVYLVIFFLAGYFLYASVYAAMGAMVSNEQDAQQVQIPVTMLIVVALMLYIVVLRNPNSTTSVVLSLIPFFAPILMVFRIALQTPPFWQIALSIVLLLVTTVGLVFVSSKIYRVGILMYGKRPSLVELFRWLRYT